MWSVWVVWASSSCIDSVAVFPEWLLWHCGTVWVKVAKAAVAGPLVGYGNVKNSWRSWKWNSIQITIFFPQKNQTLNEDIIQFWFSGLLSDIYLYQKTMLSLIDVFTLLDHSKHCLNCQFEDWSLETSIWKERKNCFLNLNLCF